MKKIIIAIMMFTCFCLAGKPTHYFEGRWYKECYPEHIKPRVVSWERIPKCSLTIYSECFEYDAKGNKIHRLFLAGMVYRYEYDANGYMIHWWTSGGVEEWYEYDAKGNKIHWRTHDGYEEWYEWFFDEKNNEKYKCIVDKNGN